VLHVTYSDATISASNRALRATVRRLSWGFPKIAPPSCAAEESTPTATFALQEDSAAKDSRRSFGTSGATADPCSVSAVFRRPDGLRLSNPARVLQRATDHGVHDVLKRSAKTVASSCLSCPSKFSPRPQLLGATLVEPRGSSVTRAGFHRSCSPPTFPPHLSPTGRHPVAEPHR
jgi:hypothetical protein